MEGRTVGERRYAYSARLARGLETAVQISRMQAEGGRAEHWVAGREIYANKNQGTSRKGWHSPWLIRAAGGRDAERWKGKATFRLSQVHGAKVHILLA